MVAISVLSVLPDTEKLPEVTKISDKLNHIAAFLVLALLMDFAHPGTEAKWILLSLLGYGLLIEVVQYFLPYREFSLLDLAADALGIVLYLGGRAAVARRVNWTKG